MARLDFFGTRADLKALIEFVLRETDARIFESYSELDQEIREFKSFEGLDHIFQIGTDPYGNGSAVLLQLWSPSVMEHLEIIYISLNPKACDGHTFRYRIGGGGLMQLYLGGVNGRIVTKSHFGHYTEREAAAWDLAEGVNWRALAKTSNRIQYHIRRRLAVAKVPGRPVLAEAYTFVQNGYELREAAQTPWKYELITDP